jgi:hypothetical protein
MTLEVIDYEEVPYLMADFIVVDDFESYNDLDPEHPESNRIWNTWLDGFNNPTNGSVVDQFSIKDWPAEGIIVHSGKRSMCIFYNNDVGKSEATMTIIYPRDWIEQEIGVMSLWFYGDKSNAPELMYIALANVDGTSGVIYHDNPNAALIDTWTEWRINLQDFTDQGVNLTKVNTISIGFGDRNNPQPGGSGEVWIDDIRLYQVSWPHLPIPMEPELPPTWPLPFPTEPPF